MDDVVDTNPTESFRNISSSTAISRAVGTTVQRKEVAGQKDAKRPSSRPLDSETETPLKGEAPTEGFYFHLYAILAISSILTCGFCFAVAFVIHGRLKRMGRNRGMQQSPNDVDVHANSGDVSSMMLTRLPVTSRTPDGGFLKEGSPPDDANSPGSIYEEIKEDRGLGLQRNQIYRFDTAVAASLSNHVTKLKQPSHRGHVGPGVVEASRPGEGDSSRGTFDPPAEAKYCELIGDDCEMDGEGRAKWSTCDLDLDLSSSSTSAQSNFRQNHSKSRPKPPPRPSAGSPPEEQRKRNDLLSDRSAYLNPRLIRPDNDQSSQEIVDDTRLVVRYEEDDIDRYEHINASQLSSNRDQDGDTRYEHVTKDIHYYNNYY